MFDVGGWGTDNGLLADKAAHGPRKGLNPPRLYWLINHIFFLAREMRTPGARKEGVP
jgi:hypothetical protein